MVDQVSKIKIVEIEMISNAGEVVEIEIAEDVEIEVSEVIVAAIGAAIVAVGTLIAMDAEGEISEIMKEEERGPNGRAGGEVTIGALTAVAVAVEIVAAMKALVTIGHYRKGSGSWLERTLARESMKAMMASSLAVAETSEAAAT